MSYLLDALLTPHKLAQAVAADAAMLALNGLRAERAVLNSAGQAINAAMRPCFDPDYGSYTGNPMDPRTDDSSDVTYDGFTSLQPLGDARVMVSYSVDSNESLSIDGATIGGDFVHIDNFSNHVRSQWEKAIRAEEAKSAEIARWGE